MRIGVDCSSIIEPPNGISRYTTEMVAALADADIELILYFPSMAPLKNSFHTNVKIRRSFFFGSIGKMIWMQTILPVMVYMDQVDVFWGPAHKLPYFISKKISSIVTIHDFTWIKLSHTMRFPNLLIEKVIMPYTLRLADKIIVDSLSIKYDLKFYFPEYYHKSYILPLAPSNISRKDIEEISLEKFGINRPFILFVGTIEPRKNLKKILESYSLLPNDVKNNFFFVVVGSQGWGDIDVIKIAAEYLVSSSVILLGNVSDSLLSLLYSKARFVVLISLYEGFGLPIIEAQSFGAPVIVSNTSSMPELVADGGLIVDPSDEKSIRDAMLSLIKDVSLREDLSKRARARSLEFSWSNSAKKFINLCEEAKKNKVAIYNSEHVL